MNTVYTLKHPFKSRRDGRDVEVAELPLPELITVGMFRKAPLRGNQMLWAHHMTEVCTGLNPIDASKVMTPDAIGYVAELAELLEPAADHGFELPEIRPVRALVAKITVDQSDALEFAAQVLQHSGMKLADINAMDVRQFLPAVPLVLGQMADPK